MPIIVAVDIYHCTLGNHNKQYLLRVEQDGAVFSLIAEWGRIGNANLQSKVYVDHGSVLTVQSMRSRLEIEKLDKGYVRVSRPAVPLTGGARGVQGSMGVSNGVSGSMPRQPSPKPAPPPAKKAPPRINIYSARRVESESEDKK